MHASGLLVLLGSSSLAAAAPTFGWLFPGYGSNNGGYGSSPPSYSPPSYSPPKYTPPAYTPPKYTPPAYTPPKYTPPAYTPPAYTPPSYTPPAYTPPAYTPPSYGGGYGSGGSGLGGWLGGIIGGLTGGLKAVFDITFFFGKKFDVELTLKGGKKITKSVGYLGKTSFGAGLDVEAVVVVDVTLNLGILDCEFLFKDELDIEAEFDIFAGFKHNFVKAGADAGLSISHVTVIGLQCNVGLPKGYQYPPGYTPPSGGKPYSYNPPAGYTPPKYGSYKN